MASGTKIIIVQILSLFVNFKEAFSFLRDIPFDNLSFPSSLSLIRRHRRSLVQTFSVAKEFGRQKYWNEVYKSESNFSWYAGWEELEPFCEEFMVKTYRILIPGVGNDKALVDMYDSGYAHLTAIDYAPEGIERCRDMLGPERIQTTETQDGEGVELLVADARDLSDEFEDCSFDAIMEKGTLDAIFLSGGKDKQKGLENLKLAISELGRCVKAGGIFMSITAVVVDNIQESFDELNDEWECLVDQDQIYMTEDGFTSNNIDGTLLVWKKIQNFKK